MTKMFTYNGKRLLTWNPFTGCNFNCSYCWARKLAETKLKASYPNGFLPMFHPERLKVKFQPDDFVFVCSMGDISFASLEVMNRVTATIKNYPATSFLFCSKAPSFLRAGRFLEPNIYLGTTIETNRYYRVSNAPTPEERYSAVREIVNPHKFLSIEPVMDFDFIEFSNWIYDINPEIVEIGADNYKNNLPEPSGDKVLKLIEVLTLHGVNVVQKQGLERLLK